MKFPIQSSENWTSGIPLSDVLSPAVGEREQDVSYAAKAYSSFAFTIFHRFNGLMEPRLATYATPTPVETSTPPGTQTT